MRWSVAIVGIALIIVLASLLPSGDDPAPPHPYGTPSAAASPHATADASPMPPLHRNPVPTLHLPRVTRTSGCVVGVLPDRRCSPGRVNRHVTQSTIGRTICAKGWTATVRDVNSSDRAAIYAEYGLSGQSHPWPTWEVDHVVPLELGGSNDHANLFPEYEPRAKDRLENALNVAVCAGRVSLTAARHVMATDWRQAPELLP